MLTWVMYFFNTLYMLYSSAYSLAQLPARKSQILPNLENQARFCRHSLGICTPRFPNGRESARPARPLPRHAAPPQSAPAPGPRAHAQSAGGRAGGRAPAVAPSPLPSSRPAGTRRRVCFGSWGPSSSWTLRGTTWPLPFLARLCSPFLTSPTTWCLWWRWSVSRVSAGSRRPAPSGYLSRSGRPEPAERLNRRCLRVLESSWRGGPTPRAQMGKLRPEGEVSPVLVEGGARSRPQRGVRGRWLGSRWRMWEPGYPLRPPTTCAAPRRFGI